jgi:small-conductance mechanosensitive channel
MIEKILSRIRAFFDKSAARKNVRKIQLSLSAAYASLGEQAHRNDPSLSKRYNLSIPQCLERATEIGLILKNMEEERRENRRKFLEESGEYRAALEKIDPILKDLKTRLKTLKATLKANEKSLNARIAADRKKSARYKVLTIFKNKGGYNKTLMEMKNLVQSNIRDKTAVEEQIRRLSEQRDEKKNAWEKRSLELKNAVKGSEIQHTKALKQKNSVDLERNELFALLGRRVLKQEPFPEELSAYKKEIEDLKSLLANEKARLKKYG